MRLFSILQQFYNLYNPQKMADIEDILRLYRGKEQVLLKNLKKKYNLMTYEPFDTYMKEFCSEELDCRPTAIASINLEKSFTSQSIANERLRRENTKLQSDLLRSEENRTAMSKIYQQQINFLLERSNEYVRCTHESRLMEIEDIASHGIQNDLLAEQLALRESVERKREIQRYRYELIAAAKEEQRLRKEIQFLQKQIVLAAEKIMNMTAHGSSYWEDPNCV